jgi:nucleoid DNA-binding protein
MKYLEEAKEAMKKEIITEYLEAVRNKLLSGDSVYLNNIGTLKIYSTKVGIKQGRNYTIKTRLRYDKEFEKSLYKEYENNNDKYISRTLKVGPNEKYFG